MNDINLCELTILEAALHVYMANAHIFIAAGPQKDGLIDDVSKLRRKILREMNLRRERGMNINITLSSSEIMVILDCMRMGIMYMQKERDAITEVYMCYDDMAEEIIALLSTEIQRQDPV